MLLISVLFGFKKIDFIKAEDAFKTDVKLIDNKINVSIVLMDNIYIYKDKIKLFINNKEITNQINFPQAVKFHDNLIYEKEFKIKIPTKSEY